MNGIRIGTDDEGNLYTADIELREKPEGVALSICGTIYGPREGARGVDTWDGRRYLSGGQCLDDFENVTHREAADIEPARLVEVWRRWHLNDMRAACEHQREWPISEPVVVFDWTLDSEGFEALRRVEKDTKSRLAAGEVVQLTPEERAILNRPLGATTYAAGKLADLVPNTKPPEHYRPSTTRAYEQKTRGWVPFKDCPELGLLSKPCETCGYQYGSRWLFEPLPDDVLAEVRGWIDAHTPSDLKR